MKDDCTPFVGRECRVTIPDGNYAMQTDSGSVSQCLVHWKEQNQIYAGCYSWGGRATTATEGDAELGCCFGDQEVRHQLDGQQGGRQGCSGLLREPGVRRVRLKRRGPQGQPCQGMETVWIFKRLEDGLYLILNSADGNSFRCFGFRCHSSASVSPATSATRSTAARWSDGLQILYLNHARGLYGQVTHLGPAQTSKCQGLWKVWVMAG